MKSFNQFLEVKKGELAKIGTHVNKILRKEMEDLPLNDIFGNKTRIVIPLTNKEEYDFQHELEKKGYQVDLKQGQVSSKIKTQVGQKERTERIGKIINNLIKKEPEHAEKWKKSLNWWEKSKENIGKQGVSIVVSRHPIDILRMSDHSEWTSCHSPSREYFKCAIQEAKTGGAVAYVVKNIDLQNVDLQKKDIFKDSDRDIEGVEPLERLRLRRLSSENVSLLLPEKRTYGIRHIGFLEAVLKWARDSQRNKINFTNPPKFEDFELHGGSYQDTSAADIWNQFFNTNVYGSKRSKEQPEEEEKAGVDPDRLDEDAQRIIREHELKHYYVSASVEVTEGGPYLYYNGGVCFEFDKDNFSKIPDYNNLRMYGGKKNLGVKIKNVLDIWIIEQIEINEHAGKIRFCLDIRDEEAGGELQNLERYLDDLDDLDKNYEQDHDKIREVLIEDGWIKDWKENWEFNHFELETEYVKKVNVHTVVSDEMWIGDLLGVNAQLVKLNINHSLEFKIYSAIHTNVAIIFPKFIKEDYIKISWESPATLSQPQIRYPSMQNEIINHRIKVKLSLEIELPSNNNERIKLYNGIKYIDKNWSYFEKRAIDWWNKISSLMLKGSTTGGFSPGIPIKPPVHPKQLELPFGESFRCFLEKNIDFFK